MGRAFHILILAVLLVFSGAIVSFLPNALKKVPDRVLVKNAQSEAEFAEALKKLSSDEIAALEQREQLALQEDPLDRNALQNLVALVDLRGDKTNAERIALALADYGRRSVAAQLSAIQIHLAKRNFDSAFDRIDGVARARGDLHAKLFPLMAAQLQGDAARLSLAKILATEPKWRQGFMRYLTGLDEQASLAYNMVASMRAVGAEILDSERRLVLSQLFKFKRFDAAYFVWLDLLSKDDLVRVRNVFDGGFDTIPRQLYFDWNHAVRKNARIEKIAKPGNPQDFVLALDFFADKEGKPFVFQFLRLTDGKYTMTYDQQVESLKTQTGLVWRIACVDTPAIRTEGPAILENGPWQSQAFSFEIPAEGCSTQVLRLENKSAAKLDQELSGRVMFDNIAINSSKASDVETVEGQ